MRHPTKPAKLQELVDLVYDTFVPAPRTLMDVSVFGELPRLSPKEIAHAASLAHGDSLPEGSAWWCSFCKDQVPEHHRCKPIRTNIEKALLEVYSAGPSRSVFRHNKWVAVAGFLATDEKAPTSIDVGDKCARYIRTRVWSARPRALFILDAPRPVHHNAVKKRLSKCCRYARAWGFGGCSITYTTPVVCEHIDDLGTKAMEPTPEQSITLDTTILSAQVRSDIVVAAWGTLPLHNKRAKILLEGPLKNRRIHVIGLRDGKPLTPHRCRQYTMLSDLTDLPNHDI